ncbi:MAG: SGNH/GDSL hydrolase family protein, partial [Candidatus Omnitrophica bacterium]|nr:SGNH/GDSL hydrolase family protein [Candidatus Omnitrophota bacterium]
MSKLVLFIFSAIFTLLLAEGLLQFFNLAPGERIDSLNELEQVRKSLESKYYVHMNQVGLRDHRDFGSKGSSRRIVFLGDSFVYGIGVSNDETFSSVAEDLLNDSSPQSWMVINAGKPATGTLTQQRLLEEILERMEVDGVVLFYCLYNDVYDNVQESYTLRGTHQKLALEIKSKDHVRTPLGKVKIWLWRHSALYRFLKLRLGQAGTLRAFPHGIFDQCDPEKSQSFREMDDLTRSVLSEIKQLLEQKKIDFSVVLIPRAEQISEEAFERFKKAYGVGIK